MIEFASIRISTKEAEKKGEFIFWQGKEYYIVHYPSGQDGYWICRYNLWGLLEGKIIKFKLFLERKYCNFYKKLIHKGLLLPKYGDDWDMDTITFWSFKDFALFHPSRITRLFKAYIEKGVEVRELKDKLDDK